MLGIAFMSGSDETAEEARRLASERAFTARRFLAALDRGEYTSVDLATVPAAERGLALPALRAMARQRSESFGLTPPGPWSNLVIVLAAMC